MRNGQLLLAILLLATGFVSNAQTGKHKLIAVVNRANWCTLCKAHGERLGANLMPYSAKGVTVLINDLTNDTTIAASNTVLQNAGVYKAVYSKKRKGMGKMLQSCGLAKGKMTNSPPSGIVTFISPETHKQLKQVSIAMADEEMKATIDNLLK
jgi:hypothetical protein